MVRSRCARLGWAPAVASLTLALLGVPTPVFPALAWAALSGLAWLLFVCATADADFALLMRPSHEKGAFDGKAVLVTGASQGLGAALAQYLSEHGAKLVLSSRSADALQAVKRSCRGKHSQDIVILPLDVTSDWDTVAEAAERADAAFDGLDYVFHVAGASQSSAAADTSADVAQKLLALNLLGPITLTRALLTHMLPRRRGRLVVVGSMASKVPSPGQALYCAAKHGLFGYFATLAAELADSGVNVTIACPGPMASERSEPRMVFGPLGMVARPDTDGKSKKVGMLRCVQLICSAAAHGLDEVWISKNPALLAGYIFQFAPALGWRLLKKIGPKRTRALQEGKSGYDYDLAKSD